MAAKRIVEQDSFRETLAPSQPYQVYDTRDSFWRAANVIYTILGLVEAVLALRLVFLLLGANPLNGFVNFIYAISGWLAAPFTGIFGQTTAVSRIARFDWATIVAMIVYAIVAWALVRIAAAFSNRPVD